MSTLAIRLGGFCPFMPICIAGGGGGGANVQEGLCPYTIQNSSFIWHWSKSIGKFKIDWKIRIVYCLL